MIRIEDPLAVLVFSVLFVAGLVVLPAMKTGRVRVTVAKAASVILALGICAYHGSLVLILLILWPLSFIWFPEFWGNYTGFLRSPYINQKSPPVLVSLLGWFFLVAFLPLLWWIGGR